MVKKIIGIIAGIVSRIAGFLWVGCLQRLLRWVFLGDSYLSGNPGYRTARDVLDRGLERHEGDRRTIEELRRILRGL